MVRVSVSSSFQIRLSPNPPVIGSDSLPKLGVRASSGSFPSSTRMSFHCRGLPWYSTLPICALRNAPQPMTVTLSGITRACTLAK